MFKLYYIRCPFGGKTQVGCGDLISLLKENFTLQNFVPMFLKSGWSIEMSSYCAILSCFWEGQTLGILKYNDRILECSEVYCMHLNGFKGESTDEKRNRLS